jgi:hypothetical protein
MCSSVCAPFHPASFIFGYIILGTSQDPSGGVGSSLPPMADELQPFVITHVCICMRPLKNKNFQFYHVNC